MMFPKLAVLAAAALPLLAAAGETVYLVNCGIGGSGVEYSVMAYYPDGSVTAGGNVPPTNDNEAQITVSGTQHWEGQAVTGHFPSGVSFTSHIQANAQSQPDFSNVGTGNNGFRNFVCFKDNKRKLFQQGEATCNSIYYCLDVSCLETTLLAPPLDPYAWR
ncbi:hypothetical protein VTK73DRAFT_7368 [Phialemonium thermophilum]|uniref:Uncharacterized protein n=1 Tax=Phialemonium thermophilum TaxID=223376 RepID=A0ABR3WEU2_9PEZI